MSKKTKKLSPVHPGEILLHDYMEPLELSRNRLAAVLKVRPMRISNICAGKTGITADTAIRLSMAFNTTAAFWMNLQCNYELALAEDSKIIHVEQLIA